ncbi:hypothetical protein TSUD_380300 [Trifolium subterraneum]|uniref:Uncharacterized protein n=1 Tax=Trifolium subterraneum TaxID=3900 RepID=A0A2Z6NW15_TRISU|nr:hypothetical protein TSUD_380300 [Trifolium subterraneum]
MISNKPVAAENKRAEDSFKAKSDESEQVVAAVAATPDMVVAIPPPKLHRVEQWF